MVQGARLRPEVPRAKLLELIAKVPPCLIGIEACSGAHHWAREFSMFGHTVRLMAPKLVAPYRMSGKRGKNDAADAAAMLLPRLRRFKHQTSRCGMGVELAVGSDDAGLGGGQLSAAVNDGADGAQRAGCV